MNTALSIENPIILNTPIKRDNEGRYCLNDLHKASGGHQKHRPKYWLETQQAQALIEKLTVGGIPPLEQNQPLKIVNGGNAQGTFAVRQLAIAYATWIDAEFFLVVIDTFDAVASGFNTLFNLDQPISLTQMRQCQAVIGEMAAKLNKAQVVCTVGELMLQDQQAKKQQYEAICEMVKSGINRDRISSELGITRNNVRQVIFQAKRNGDLTAEQGGV